MTPEQYDAWYQSARGRWIGDTEYGILCELLQAPAGSSVIDVGCGTGYFTRRLARDGYRVHGIDIDPRMIQFARAHGTGAETYAVANACALPFTQGQFDYCLSVTALGFIEQQEVALAEMLRISRARVLLGLLNRYSLLYLQKGRHGGSGAYRGAHWHTAAEVQGLARTLGVRHVKVRFGIFAASGSRAARIVEGFAPKRLPLGAFLGAAFNAR